MNGSKLTHPALFISAAIVLLVAAAPLTAQSVAAPQSAQSMNGNWQITNGNMHGQPVPTNVLSTMLLSITDTQFVAKSGSLNSTGTLTANPQANPAQMDLAITGGADQGRNLKAIYRLENGTLTITFSETDQYPASFDSTADNKYLTLVYRQGTGSETAGTIPTNDNGSGGSTGLQ